MRYALIAYKDNGEIDEQASFMFDSRCEDVDTEPTNRPYLLNVLLEDAYDDPNSRYKNVRIFKLEDAPFQPERWRCQFEGCEQAHCKRCGFHYDPYAAYGSGICDDCQIQDARATAEAQAAQFGGNYEEAASYYGW